MLVLTVKHIISIAITLLGIVMVGIYSGKKIKSSSDFSVGGKKAGSCIIAGTIMGTLVGGASTIGTAQLAYTTGFSAWWFTLGAGIGCLILGLFFVKPLYKTNKETLPQILTENYGEITGSLSSVFTSIGIYINIIAQVLSGIALLTTMFRIPSIVAAIIVVLLMMFYVIFGGVWGTGIVGVAKLILIYVSVIVGGFLAMSLQGGVSAYSAALPAFPYFSLLGRGAWIDLAAGLSLVIGVLSTQTYIQAVISGKTQRESLIGCLISAALIPPIGVAGIFIGMFMKLNHPNIDPASAFPLFVLQHMNPWIGGVVLATLLIGVVGTGAGLALGVSTIFTKDIYKKYLNRAADDRQLLVITRLAIVIVLLVCVVFVTGNLKSLILKWSFMSMGLRGAAAFVPLCFAMFSKKKIKPIFAALSVILGPLTVLVGKLIIPPSFDPLFFGILISFSIIFLGWIISLSSNNKANHDVRTPEQ